MSARDDLSDAMYDELLPTFGAGLAAQARDALLPVVEEAVVAARIEALTDAGQEACERGDIGKPGGVEAWVWLPARAAALAEEPRP